MEEKRPDDPEGFVETYSSPLGLIYLRYGAAALSGLWICPMAVPAAVRSAATASAPCPARIAGIRRTVRDWLDCYFSHRVPTFVPPLELEGSAFRLRVWRELLRIPCGATATYGDVARVLSTGEGHARLSPQAVGGAVGHNPVALIVPCHRVVGSGGRLVGYGGGLPLKAALLDWERTMEPGIR